MKRVLFVVTYFDCGGTCRALQNLLNVLDTAEYEVDVFGLVQEGMFEKGMFRNCSIVPADRQLQLLYARYASTTGWRRRGAAALKVLDRLSGRRYNRWMLKRRANKLIKKGNYDMVVAFSEGLVTKFMSMAEHPNKVAWIHCDYANFHRMAGQPDELPIYDGYKSIVCVSNFTKSSFTGIYPTLADKTHAIYNVLDTAMMHNLAEKGLPEGVTFDSNTFNIVSIGRLDPVKRLSAIPGIAKQLIDKGMEFTWWVIGPKGGTDEEYRKLMTDIERLNLQDTVRYLGEQQNPYPFIKHADLLVNTSISEACPYVVNEAKVLGTPVVCTDFGSADEFIEQEKTGLITPIESMAEAIFRAVNEPGLMQDMRENPTAFKYDNEKIIKEFKNLIK